MEGQLNSIEVRTKPLSLADLDHVTAIHCAAFPESALTKLGAEAVRRYYEWQMVGPHDAVNIGAWAGEVLIGFCFGGIFRGAMGGFLEANRSFLIRRVILHPWLLLNPLFRERARFAIDRVTRRTHRRRAEPTSPPPSPVQARSFGILSIAVLPDYQGQGAAQVMMEYAERSAREREFVQMGLTVHPANMRAVRFYEKMGWKRDIRETEWTGNMSKVIGGTVPPSTIASEVTSP